VSKLCAVSHAIGWSIARINGLGPVGCLAPTHVLTRCMVPKSIALPEWQVRNVISCIRMLRHCGVIRLSMVCASIDPTLVANGGLQRNAPHAAHKTKSEFPAGRIDIIVKLLRLGIVQDVKQQLIHWRQWASILGIAVDWLRRFRRNADS